MIENMRGPLLLTALLLAAAAPSYAQTQDDPPQRDTRPGYYVGLSSCANGICHGAVEAQGTTAVLQNEYPTWMLGPHRRSFQVLENALSREIAEALEGPGAEATRMKLCRDCHTLNVSPGRGEGIFEEDGISCEACHGAAGGWRDRHIEEGFSYAQSLRAGMKDLRDPAKRAELCYSCHLGNEEKAVDHRLIAAGHPRLYFELDNGTGALPRHWKLDSRRPDRRASHGVRAWAVGQAVSFREGLEQLARPAAASGWPDFALYNCQSCHHSLADSTWRKAPGYRFAGGLPRPSMARYAVLRTLIAGFATDELQAFDDAVRGLEGGLASLGRPDEIASQASALAERTGTLAEKLARIRWSENDVRSAMERLITERETFLVDLAAAEQLAFALQSLMGRLIELDRKRLRSPLVAGIDDVFRALDDPDAFDRESFDRLVAALLEKPPLRASGTR